MSEARAAILARVRQGLGERDLNARRAAAESWLAARQGGPQPVLDQDLVARFRSKAESLASTVSQVATTAEVPQAVAAYLAAQGIAPPYVAAPDCLSCDWSAAGLAVRGGSAVDADQAGISGCYCAIAETGTLMLLSGPATPASVSLLPETHIALVPVARIVPTMEAAFALLRAECGKLPRAVNFVSGPSRTGDIEQTIVLGAHGPCRVHLILIGKTE